MSATQALFDAVRARGQGTAYVVEPTADGFDVRLALEDPQWFGRLREQRLTQAATYHVQALEASRSIMIADEIRTLGWVAGANGREGPRLGATLAVASGRVTSRNVRRTCSSSPGSSSASSLSPAAS